MNLYAYKICFYLFDIYLIFFNQILKTAVLSVFYKIVKID